MAARKKNNNSGTVAEGKLTGNLPDAIIQESKTVTGVAREIPEDAVIIQPKPKHEQRIMATQKGVKMYSRPSLLPDAVIGTMPPNMSFAVRGKAVNPFGEFYKLKDGRFVSKGDAVKEI